MVSLLHTHTHISGDVYFALLLIVHMVLLHWCFEICDRRASTPSISTSSVWLWCGCVRAPHSYHQDPKSKREKIIIFEWARIFCGRAEVWVGVFMWHKWFESFLLMMKFDAFFYRVASCSFHSHHIRKFFLSFVVFIFHVCWHLSLSLSLCFHTARFQIDVLFHKQANWFNLIGLQKSDTQIYFQPTKRKRREKTTE